MHEVASTLGIRMQTLAALEVALGDDARELVQQGSPVVGSSVRQKVELNKIAAEELDDVAQSVADGQTHLAANGLAAAKAAIASQADAVALCVVRTQLPDTGAQSRGKV